MKERVGSAVARRRISERQPDGPEDFEPDLPPMTAAELARAPVVPRVKTLRRAMGMTQEMFAASYAIPLGTLRDWEQGATQPDAPARAYLRAIAGDPEAVRRALTTIPLAPGG